MHNAHVERVANEQHHDSDGHRHNKSHFARTRTARPQKQQAKNDGFNPAQQPQTKPSFRRMDAGKIGDAPAIPTANQTGVRFKMHKLGATGAMANVHGNHIFRGSECGCLVHTWLVTQYATLFEARLVRSTKVGAVRLKPTFALRRKTILLFPRRREVGFSRTAPTLVERTSRASKRVAHCVASHVWTRPT